MPEQNFTIYYSIAFYPSLSLYMNLHLLQFYFVLFLKKKNRNPLKKQRIAGFFNNI